MASLNPADPAMRRGVRAGIVLVLLLAAGLAVVTAIHDFPDVDWQFRPLWLAGGILGFGTLVLVDAELWRRLLHALGPRLSRKQAASIWCASALGRYVPTSLLLPVIRIAMAESAGVPKRICLASIVYEIALAFTGALIVGAYFVVDLPDLQGQPLRFLAIALPVLALVALQPGIFHPAANFVFRKLGRPALPLALPTRRVLEFAILYSLTFVLAGISVYTLAQCVVPVDGSDLVAVIGAFAAATTLSILAFVLPAGLIAREAGLALALAPVMAAAPALAVAVLARIVQIVTELVLALATQVMVRSTRSPSEAGSPSEVGARE